jgi:hypothetical protein
MTQGVTCLKARLDRYRKIGAALADFRRMWARRQAFKGGAATAQLRRRRPGDEGGAGDRHPGLWRRSAGHELPVPEPGGGQVQVTIEVAATNPLDGAIASGALATHSTRSAASPDARAPAPLTSRN